MVELFETADYLSEDNWSEKKFVASLKGIDLDGEGSSKKKEAEVMERVVAKANAILSGNDPESEESIERQKYSQMDIDYEIIN